MSIKWFPKIQWPDDSDYIVRIIGAEFKPSRAGNPMLIIDQEVAGPNTKVTYDDSGNEIEVVVAGAKLHKRYMVTVGVNKEGQTDESKTVDAHNRVIEFMEHFGVSTDNINWDNIDIKPFIGKKAFAIVKASVEPQRKPQTPEQKRLGQPGAPMKNPKTGKEMIQYWPEAVEFFGPAGEDSMPY